MLDNSRGWMAAGAAATLILVVLCWLLLFSPKLADTSSIHDQTDALTVTNATLQTELVSLKTQQHHMDRYVAKLVRARLGLPITAAVPAFSKETSQHAASSGVKVTSMSVGTIAVAGAAAAAAGVSVAPTTGAAAGQLYGIPVTLVTEGRYRNQITFLTRLKYTGPRVALVSGSRFAGTETETNLDKGSTMTTTLTLFVAPQSPEQAAMLQKQLAGHS
jgi:hypothetical protein